MDALDSLGMNLEKASAMRGTPIGGTTPSGKLIRTGRTEYTPVEEYKLKVEGDGHKEVAAKIKQGIEASADICKVSPPVCKGNLGIARKDMPQIGGDVEKRFIESYQKRGIKTEKKTMPVGQLKATQMEIDAKKAAGMAHSFKNKLPDPRTGKPFDPRKGNILVSKDGHIVDGHHRFAVALMVDPNAQMEVTVIDVPIRQLLKEANAFPGVTQAGIKDPSTKSMSGLDGLGDYLQKSEAAIDEWSAAGGHLSKAGPYIGPRGGKYADPEHKIPYIGPGEKPSVPTGLPSAETAIKDIRKVAKNPNPTDVRSVMITATAAARGNPDTKAQMLRAVQALAKVDMPPASKKLVDKVTKMLSKSGGDMDGIGGIGGIGEYLEKGHVAMGHGYTQVGPQDPEQEARIAAQTAPTIAAFQSVDMVKNDGHDDGKPGESLGETDTAELTATHGDLQTRLKAKPDDPAMTARLKAICGELKRRGKHSEHAMEKGLPSEEARMSPDKAKQILRDGEVHGKPLSEAQRGMFGAIAGKARKSMSGIDALGDYLEKGHGATVGETVTSSPQRNLGAETGAISGDDDSGKGALPHGETDYYGIGEEDGDYEGLQRHTTGSGPNPMGPGNAEKPDYLADPTGALMEGHASGRYRKSMPDGTLLTPGRQMEMAAQERAQVMGELNKSDDVVVGVGIDPIVPVPEPEPVAKAWMHGDLVVMTDFSDLAVEKMQKSGDFYHGDAPRVGQSGLLRKSKLCARGHQMPAMLTSCPGCGVGSQFNASAPTLGYTMQKGGGGLRQAYEPDMVLPQGIVLTDE